MGSQGLVKGFRLQVLVMKDIPQLNLLMAALVACLMGCGRDQPEPVTEVPATNAVVTATNAVPERPPVQYSAGASNIVNMVRAGMDDIVIRNQIMLATSPYQLKADDLVWMTEQGVSQGIIGAVIQQDQQLQAFARQTEINRTRAMARKQNEARLRRELEQAREELAKRPVTQAPVAQNGLPRQVVPFHDALAPYGAWIKHQQYGLIWQPSILRRQGSWRPYADNGRWLATDQGWYWHSEYPWGWAVFHYGRWGYERNVGWYWVPDTIWGPSWVTFRSNGDYIGWAPLPPGAIATLNLGVTYRGRPVGRSFNYGLSSMYYNFVPRGHVFNLGLPALLVSRPLIPGFFPRTTVINNIIIGDGNTIINNGVSISRLARANAGPIQLTRIQALRDYSVDQFGAIVRKADGVTVFRPSLAHIAPVKPAVIRQGNTNVPVLLPKQAPNDVVIAGEPVVDTSTGVPVVTGYRNPRRYYYPIRSPQIATPQLIAPAVSPIPTTQVGQSPFGATTVGFSPAMPQNPPQILGAPTPVSPNSAMPGFNTVTNPASGQRHYRYVPGSSQHHWYNRR